ncbi:Uncharacterised protein [Mycobacteroides abscessus]|nr:Uncharacterised protein [Mycobacteroides abscessus]
MSSACVVADAMSARSGCSGVVPSASIRSVSMKLA